MNQCDTSVKFPSFLPVNGSWYPSYHRHQMYGVDTSVWVRAPQETRRWIEMYQRWINTPNSLPSSIPPSLQQMLQLSPHAMWFHFCLFALWFPSLSWVDAETPCETACQYASAELLAKRDYPSSVMHTMGLRDPHCKPEGQPLTFREAMKWRETSHFPPPELEALLGERKHC